MVAVVHRAGWLKDMGNCFHVRTRSILLLSTLAIFSHWLWVRFPFFYASSTRGDDIFLWSKYSEQKRNLSNNTRKDAFSSTFTMAFPTKKRSSPHCVKITFALWNFYSTEDVGWQDELTETSKFAVLETAKSMQYDTHCVFRSQSTCFPELMNAGLESAMFSFLISTAIEWTREDFHASKNAVESPRK